MKKIIVWALSALFMTSGLAAAQGVLNSNQSVEIKGSIWKVWDAVKDFDGVVNWHPAFSESVIISGANEEVGAVRTLTLKDGPSFDEELTSYEVLDRKFSYRVIDPAPLPVSSYASTFQVLEGRRGFTLIQWRGSYRNNSEGKMKDEEVIALIDGLYRAGLDNLRSMLESQ